MEFGQALELTPVMFMMSVVFALPTLIVMYVAAQSLTKFTKNSLHIRAVIIAILITGIIVSFKLIGGALSWILSVVYCISALVSVLILLVAE